MFNKIEQVIAVTNIDAISAERRTVLDTLARYISDQRKASEIPKLNFICTHNSRRSQLAQVWAKVAAVHFDIELKSYSGGTEVTACHPNTCRSLERLGFELTSDGGENPRYHVVFGESLALELYSKRFDDPANPKTGFAAVMTCSHADENCPYVPGCDQRIPLLYDDPKMFDGSPLEAAMYDARSYQIATEMMYVFSNVNHEE